MRDDFNKTQIERQYSGPAYSGKRILEFGPFEEALKKLSSERIATLDEKLLNADIAAIQQMFTAGELTSEELALYYLDRIKRYDVNKLNSILELNPEALEIARKCDQERQAGQVKGNLHGIPVCLKDNIGTGDQMHNSAGAKVLENSRADRDAFIVRKLRDAGAIILGKTNLSEWANFMTSNSANGFSVLGGQTKSPYGKFDISGSSSGSAAAVAANLVTVSLGSETSGSLVSPASQNAVVTLKPSLGLVSRDRIIPITAAQDTAGPMGRSVADVALVMSVIAGYDADDPAASLAKSLDNTDFTQYLDKNSLQGMKVGVVAGGERARIGDAAMYEKMTRMLKEAGAEVKELNESEIGLSIDFLDILSYGINHDLEAYLATIGEKEIKSLADVVNFNREDLANRAPFGQDLLEAALEDKFSAEEYTRKAQENREKLQQAIAGFLEKHDLELIASLANQLSATYAPAGCPALTVPLAYRENGEPVGLTFVGKYLDDGLLIKAAYAFEQAHPVRKNPELE